MRNNGFSADKIIIDILVFCISYGFVDCLVLITLQDRMGSHRSCLVIIKITMDSSVTRQSFHALAKTYKEMWERFPKAKFLGLTATPCRLNGKGFTDLFDVLVPSRR